MKPEAQRIAIAEACGWVSVGKWGHSDRWIKPGEKMPEWSHVPDGAGVEMPALLEEHKLPNYLSDLNAMHEAEKVLTNEQRRFYALKLVHVHPLQYDPCDCGDDTRMKLFLIASMTAAQRAEAFLRTIGKWEESA